AADQKLWNPFQKWGKPQSLPESRNTATFLNLKLFNNTFRGKLMHNAPPVLFGTCCAPTSIRR
ncbi:MAG TPA: hypothetical protein PK992_16850, partial [Planctomycetaceae bacterium]|nr:hypothetical protein [Planctomycetaceae bacterium]